MRPDVSGKDGRVSLAHAEQRKERKKGCSYGLIEPLATYPHKRLENPNEATGKRR